MIAALALFVSFGAFAQGIDFQDISLKEALEKSAAEKKPVFLDCYTSWCGPCKFMANEVFTLKQAGDWFNPRFVNIKIDMEKGEGPEIAKKYGIRAYPTFLILNADGTLRHTVVGGGQIDDFIDKVAAGMDSKNTPESLAAGYEAGTLKNDGMLKYWNVLRAAGDRAKVSEVAGQLYTQLSKKEKTKQAFWPIVNARLNSQDSAEALDFILANRKAFDKNVGRDKVETAIYNSFSQTIQPYVAGFISPSKYEELPAVIARLDAVELSNKDALTALAALATARGNNDTEAYIATFAANSDKFDIVALGNIVNGATMQLSSNGSKADYRKAGETLLGMVDSAKDRPMKEFLTTSASNFIRQSNVGVYWEHFDSFEEALAQADKASKPLFVDCYTEWCGPCQYMANNVFTQEKVGDFFNSRFINIKLDMEKGEGPEFAKKYGVRAFPTFLVFTPDGKVRHTMVGGAEGDEFIERTKEAFDNKKATGMLQEKYEAGERGEELVMTYLRSLQRNGSPKAAEVAAEMFASLTDEQKTSPDYWFFFEDMQLSPAGSDAEAYLLANISRFRETIGREKTDQRVGMPYYHSLFNIIAGRDKKSTAADIDKIAAKVKSLGLSNGPVLAAYANIAKLYIKGDYTASKYKKEMQGKAIEPEESPFYFLYRGIRSNLTPAQDKAWKAWGYEIVSSMTDERAQKAYRMLLEE